MFNSNIEDGGVSCVVATVMQNTGVSIDHVMTVDFTGFKNIVDAMGTVEICTTSPVKDKYSGLDLAAGRHRLDGEQALAFVRQRYRPRAVETGRQRAFVARSVLPARDIRVTAFGNRVQEAGAGVVSLGGLYADPIAAMRRAQLRRGELVTPGV